MAKGARASTKKVNNQKLKSRVFGPVETARTERLSAKLLELASQPKPKPAKEDIVMEPEEGRGKECSILFGIGVLTEQAGSTAENEVPVESKQAEGTLHPFAISCAWLIIICRDGIRPGDHKERRSYKDRKQRPS
jgi:hypothetical protein